MKRLVAFAVFLAMATTVPALSYAEQTNKYDFRKTRWGMSKEEVKEAEEIKPVQDANDYLIYTTSLLGKKFNPAYIFNKGRLEGAGYDTEEDVSKYDFISLYNSLFQLLKEKYGEPKTQENIWIGDSKLSKNPENINAAIAAGEMRKSAEWETNTSEIVLFCSGLRHKIFFSLKYINKNYPSKKKDDNHNIMDKI